MTVLADRRLERQDLRTADFDYSLPAELIAQSPLQRRDDSRLMVLDRHTGSITHSSFKELGSWLTPGDLLVANNSRVIPARLRGNRIPSGGAVELLLLRKLECGAWTGLAKPGKRLKPGDRVRVAALSAGRPAAMVIVEENLGAGELVVRLEDRAEEDLGAYGQPPLPPYIRTSLNDAERYQTVYARVPGSAAAPTAGMHFTDEMIGDLRRQGLDWAEVTLHIGLDTFRPVTEDFVINHAIHREWCEVPNATAHAIAACRRRGRRVIAIGTTVARTLETLGREWDDDSPTGFAGWTDCYIVPGHNWRLVDGMVTNFHLPRSTLLMLVSALAGSESILAAYAEAVRQRYRFYSFGDAMLIR